MLSKRTFSLFQHPGYVSVVQLGIDHDDDVGITFDKYGPDRLDNSFPSGGSLSSGAFFLWVIGRKYFNIPYPDIANMTNPDKPKLVNYITVRKICRQY